MDLELGDEQIWLSESLETLLEREWTGAPGRARAGEAERDGLWRALVEFGALSIEREDGLGAVELCLAARALGAGLASVPYVGSAAVRFAVEPFAGDLPERFSELAAAGDRVAIALLEPRMVAFRTCARGSAPTDCTATRSRSSTPARSVAGGRRLSSPVRGLALVPAGASGARRAAMPSTPRCSAPCAAGAELRGRRRPGRHQLLARMSAMGALRRRRAVGAAARCSTARRYAGERRQFGRTIGSNQALRHLLAQMYVRHASSWSTVLYAAAALDDDLPDAEQTAAVAKAYVARAAREVAHGAMQVFGGIAFTEEHPAHRLRRIIVREQQFGDAAHRARAGPAPRRPRGRTRPARRPTRALRHRSADEDVPLSTGFNDPTAQRLERIATGAEPDWSARSRGGHARSALGRVRRRPDLRRQVQPHLPRRVGRRRADPAPPAAGAHPADRPRHGARVPRPDRAGGDRRPRSAHVPPG